MASEFSACLVAWKRLKKNINLPNLFKKKKPKKTYLEAVLRTALLEKTEDESFVFFLSGLRGRLLKNP
ncbi:hypothetical protein CWM41_28265, partial [Escherichia coli]